MQNILFRADSSSTIGTGHIMRDLVLASQFKDANIIFATQNLSGNINHKIEEAGYKVKSLKSNNQEEFLELIEKESIDMIVIDNYEIDENFEKTLKEKTGVKIFVLDDTYEKHHCDILLNHNIYADKNKYNDLVPKNCELRCGSKYTLLRDEFIEAKKNKKINNLKKLNIFIGIGGTDHSNINISILKVLNNFKNIKINLVTTTSNKNLEELKKHIKNNDTITLHINTDKIAKLMSISDIAIVTPSVTLNEIFYMGLPFIAIKTAKNQDEMYNYLLNNNYLCLENFNVIMIKKYLKRVINEK